MSEHRERPVRRATWDRLTTDDLYGIVRLRNRVFALEQRVSAEDFDGRDREPGTEHWWFGADGLAEGPDPVSATVADPSAVVGYLRLIRPATDEAHPDGAAAPTRVVGRVATHPEHRGRGIARRLVAAVVDAHGGEPMVLHAQEYVAALYEQHGFVRFGAPYDEAGIRHVGMYRPARPVR